MKKLVTDLLRLALTGTFTAILLFLLLAGIVVVPPQYLEPTYTGREVSEIPADRILERFASPMPFDRIEREYHLSVPDKPLCEELIMVRPRWLVFPVGQVIVVAADADGVVMWQDRGVP